VKAARSEVGHKAYARDFGLEWCSECDNYATSFFVACCGRYSATSRHPAKGLAWQLRGNRPAAAMACQALEEGAACGAIVLGSSSFERIGKRAVSGVVVQCILCPLLAIHGNIEQPHGLPRFGTMSALEQGLFWRCRNLRGKIFGSAKRCRVCCRKIQKRSICTRS